MGRCPVARRLHRRADSSLGGLHRGRTHYRAIHRRADSSPGRPYRPATSSPGGSSTAPAPDPPGINPPATQHRRIKSGFHPHLQAPFHGALSCSPATSSPGGLHRGRTHRRADSSPANPSPANPSPANPSPGNPSPGRPYRPVAHRRAVHPRTSAGFAGDKSSGYTAPPDQIRLPPPSPSPISWGAAM